MTLRRSAASAVLAWTLAACASPAGAAPAGPASPPPAPASGAAAADPLPGVSLEGLGPEQRQLVLDFAKQTFCYCGCPHTLEQCLRQHGTCRHAPRMAALAVRLARGGARKEELSRLVTSYYASFDKRARLDVARFGPPLGSADAPVTMVEFSDFTCPYCQLIRPALESFVEARQARVKLVFKPFPIESHPGALEMAQAGEWARDQKLFWPMHDALFANKDAHSPDALAALARQIGGDPESLRSALADGRYVARIRESQSEARAAGIKGTPSLFLNGRPLVLLDLSEEGLELTLQDEEEWAQHGGWQHD
jgi:protein-disulfide isomerase